MKFSACVLTSLAAMLGLVACLEESNAKIHPGMYPMDALLPASGENNDHVLRRRALANVKNCEVKSVYLENLGDIWIEGDFIGQQGTAYGGIVNIFDNVSYQGNAEGQYEFYTRFTFSSVTEPSGTAPPPGSIISCMGDGAYTFGFASFPPSGNNLDQVNWTASCANYPYATITGGQGTYLGAKGYVELFIDDGAGFRHDIHICKKDGKAKKA